MRSIFLAVAEELHFGRAAERLHVSTARVSQTVRKLEGRVGGQLFERTSRRVALTPIGRRLYDDLAPAYRQIQEGVERAVRAARGIRDTLRVGFVGASAGQFVLEVAAGFEVEHPEIDVQIRENQFGDGLELLRGGEIDMPLTVLAPRHRPDGEEYERGPTFATIQEMLALVGAGKGTYPVPVEASEFYVRPDVAYVRIHDAPTFDWRFIWPAAAETRRIRAFDRAAAAHARARVRDGPRAKDG